MKNEIKSFFHESLPNIIIVTVSSLVTLIGTLTTMIFIIK